MTAAVEIINNYSLRRKIQNKLAEMEYAEIIHEGKWLQGLIYRFVDSTDIFDKLVIDDAVEWRIRYIFKKNDVSTRKMASLLYCVFSSNTVEEIVWFGIGYLSEIVNFLRRETLCEYEEECRIDFKFRDLVWKSTRKLVKVDLFLMISQIVRTASEVSGDTEMIKNMCIWGDTVMTRCNNEKVPKVF